MPNSVWINDGKLVVSAEGKVVLCDECPCTGTGSTGTGTGSTGTGTGSTGTGTGTQEETGTATATGSTGTGSTGTAGTGTAECCEWPGGPPPHTDLDIEWSNECNSNQTGTMTWQTLSGHKCSAGYRFSTTMVCKNAGGQCTVPSSFEIIMCCDPDNTDLLYMTIKCDSNSPVVVDPVVNSCSPIDIEVTVAASDLNCDDCTENLVINITEP